VGLFEKWDQRNQAIVEREIRQGREFDARPPAPADVRHGYWWLLIPMNLLGAVGASGALAWKLLRRSEPK